MIDYQLESDEVLLLELNANVETSFSKSDAREIALTNKHIIIPFRGFFDKVKELKKIPIRAVNVYQGNAAITINERIMDSTVIDINLTNGRIQIRATENKKKCRELVNQINQLLCGTEYTFATSSFPGMEGVADALKGTIDVFKKSFGVMPQTRIVNCSSCSAQITGEKGKVIYCQYCGIPNQL